MNWQTFRQLKGQSVQDYTQEFRRRALLLGIDSVFCINLNSVRSGESRTYAFLVHIIYTLPSSKVFFPLASKCVACTQTSSRLVGLNIRIVCLR